MFLKKVRKDYKILKAFQEIFYEEGGNLKPQAKIILEFLRNEAGARGEMGQNGVPYFYDNQNKFDVNAAAFLLGKRRMFDLIIKYLAINELEVFNLYTKLHNQEDEDKVADYLSI